LRRRTRARASEQESVRTTRNVGLALAGGGARGGYHVGAVEALAKYGVAVRGIAGTSIGALNAVTIAAASTLHEGVEDMVREWSGLTADVGEPPIPSGPGREPAAVALGNLGPRVLEVLLHRGHLERLVDDVVTAFFARPSMPVWVTAYPVLPPLVGVPSRVVGNAIDWLRGKLGARSRILHLNELEPDEAKQAVLASAALPFLFPSRVVRGMHLRDGKLGGDNLPIRALAELGFDVIVAVHLRQGGVPQEYPHLPLLDILPSAPLGDRLDFSPSRFRANRTLGYTDADGLLRTLRTQLASEMEARHAHHLMRVAVDELFEPL
jgi:NTE family protein